MLKYEQKILKFIQKNQKEQEIFRNLVNKIQKLLKTFEINKKTIL